MLPNETAGARFAAVSLTDGRVVGAGVGGD